MALMSSEQFSLLLYISDNLLQKFNFSWGKALHYLISFFISSWAEFSDRTMCCTTTHMYVPVYTFADVADIGHWITCHRKTFDERSVPPLRKIHR